MTTIPRILPAVLAVTAPLTAQAQIADLGDFTDQDPDLTRVVILADFNGDGAPELFAGNASFDQLYRNDGRGNFIDMSSISLPREAIGTMGAAVGDVNGDGLPDLVLATFGQNRLYLNNGGYTFSNATARLPSDQDETTAVALGDVDGDGDLDIVFGNGDPGNSTAQDRLLLNDGSGTFLDATPSHLPASALWTGDVVLVDIDADADLDLVTAHAYYGVKIFDNDGTGVFSDATTTRLPDGRMNAAAFGVGDLDGDGDPDLAVCSGNAWLGPPIANHLLFNDGTGTFVRRISRSPAGSKNCAVGDLDGDGDLDLVFSRGLPSVSPNSPYLPRVELNDGAGNFQDPPPGFLSTLPAYTPSMALADVDRDGDLDLVRGNRAANRLELNLLRHLDAPTAPRIGETYRLEVYARGGRPRVFEVACPFLSLAAKAIPLPGLGHLGIDPAFATALPPVLVPQPEGQAPISVAVPNTPGLRGLRVYTQVLHIPFGLPAHLGNVTTDVVR